MRNPTLPTKRSLQRAGRPRRWIFALLLALSMVPATAAARQTAAPRNVILMIGDGMGFGQIEATRLFAHGVGGTLFFETAPYRGSLRTSSAGDLVTDSAAAATAMGTGQKVINGVLALEIPGSHRELETVLEHYQQRCWATGLVVTSVINHATPAAFAAHRASRYDLFGITADLFQHTRPDILFGGAGLGVTSEMAVQAGYTVVGNRAEMARLDPASAYRVSGQFGSGHMGYEYDHDIGSSDFYVSQPFLHEMTAKALTLLENRPDGFFLMVEGSRIDHASHENRLDRTVYETLAFAVAVETVLDWASGRDDTLVIVTADHETGGLAVTANNGAGHLPDVRWSGLRHSAADVPVYAWGPNGDQVFGVMDNTDLYRIMTSGSGPPRDDCGRREENPVGRTDTPPTPLPAPTATPTPTTTPTAPPRPQPAATPTVLIITADNAGAITTPTRAAE